MRFERPGLVVVLGLVVGASACGSVLAEPVACRELGEDACRLRSDCLVNGCAPCSGGGSGFINCYDPTKESQVLCGPCPPPCSSLLTETLCKEMTGCRPHYCADCVTGGAAFSVCADEADQTNTCPAILCPLPCTLVTTKETCEARTDCHSVFVDDGLCGCAGLGCCTRFSRCADGASAVCKAPPIVCDAVAPHCEGPYVVAYSDSCYEGCVQSSDCAVN